MTSEEILAVTQSVEPIASKLKHRHRRKSQNYGESWKRWPILALYTLFNVNIAFQVWLTNFKPSVGLKNCTGNEENKPEVNFCFRCSCSSLYHQWLPSSTTPPMKLLYGLLKCHW